MWGVEEGLDWDQQEGSVVRKINKGSLLDPWAASLFKPIMKIKAWQERDKCEDSLETESGRSHLTTRGHHSYYGYINVKLYQPLLISHLFGCPHRILFVRHKTWIHFYIEMGPFSCHATLIIAPKWPSTLLWSWLSWVVTHCEGVDPGLCYPFFSIIKTCTTCFPAVLMISFTYDLGHCSVVEASIILMLSSQINTLAAILLFL